MNIQGLFADFQKAYYTQVIMFVIELIALIIGIFILKKNKTAKLFVFYIAFDFACLVINWIILLAYIPRNISVKFTHISNVLIGLVELKVYFYFFGQVLSGKKILLWLRFCFSFYSLIILTYLFFVNISLIDRFKYISYSVGAFEFILLLPPCLIFYYQILNLAPGISLKARPSFWIVTGIFFYSIISIPYYLLTTYLATIKHEYRSISEAALYYIPFTINFVFLIKAFSCKKSLTI